MRTAQPAAARPVRVQTNKHADAHKQALALWAASSPAAGTPAALYLAWRYAWPVCLDGWPIPSCLLWITAGAVRRELHGWTLPGGSLHIAEGELTAALAVQCTARGAGLALAVGGTSGLSPAACWDSGTARPVLNVGFQCGVTEGLAVKVRLKPGEVGFISAARGGREGGRFGGQWDGLNRYGERGCNCLGHCDNLH